jgi:hypothetical protein
LRIWSDSEAGAVMPNMRASEETLRVVQKSAGLLERVRPI